MNTNTTLKKFTDLREDFLYWISLKEHCKKLEKMYSGGIDPDDPYVEFIDEQIWWRDVQGKFWNCENNQKAFFEFYFDFKALDFERSYREKLFSQYETQDQITPQKEKELEDQIRKKRNSFDSERNYWRKVCLTPILPSEKEVGETKAKKSYCDWKKVVREEYAMGYRT